MPPRQNRSSYTAKKIVGGAPTTSKSRKRGPYKREGEHYESNPQRPTSYKKADSPPHQHTYPLFSGQGSRCTVCGAPKM